MEFHPTAAQRPAGTQAQQRVRGTWTSPPRQLCTSRRRPSVFVGASNQSNWLSPGTARTYFLRPPDCQEPGSVPEPYARQSSMDYLYLCGSNLHTCIINSLVLAAPLWPQSSSSIQIAWTSGLSVAETDNIRKYGSERSRRINASWCECMRHIHTDTYTDDLPAADQSINHVFCNSSSRLSNVKCHLTQHTHTHRSVWSATSRVSSSGVSACSEMVVVVAGLQYTKHSSFSVAPCLPVQLQ